MKFYKKAYNIISLLVFGCGLLFIPFLKYIVGEVTVDVNIYVIYLMFLISTATSYTLSYRRNLVIANQKNYIINIIHIVYIIILNISQLVFLFATKNYYLYLGIKIICQILENAVCYIIASKMYPIIKKKNTQNLDKDTTKDIFKKVKALIYHKLGYSVVCGTDNIVISTFFGVTTVGLYTNYNMIINSLNTLFSQIITSTTASVGNLLVEKNNFSERFKVFKRIRFINFWLACFSGICALTMMDAFIKIWVGEKYILPTIVLVVIIINYFQNMMRSTYNAFKDSGGIWYEDRYVPILESLLNILFSIILLKIFGLAGVFMGTIVSSLVLWCYSYPKFVYQKLFNRSFWNYMKESFGYLLLFLILALITFVVSRQIVFSNNLLQLVFSAIISILIPNIILVILFRNTDNFQYVKSLLIKLLNKFKKKIVKA